MGLAASQARFLAITARKASCEFQSMQLAQEKLSLTRALANATQKYQNSLNQTKLVWDMDGTTGTAGATGETYDLTYDVMMTPSALNSYDPYFITSRTGKIVLNSAMAKAAEAAGIARDGSTTPDESGFYKFLECMGQNGAIAPSTVTTLSAGYDIEGAHYSYYISDAGIGGEPIDKTGANAMTIGTMLVYIKDKLEEEPYDSSWTSGGGTAEPFGNKATFVISDLYNSFPSGTGESENSDAQNKYAIFVNSSKLNSGSTADDIGGKTFDLLDLLSGNVTYVAQEGLSEQDAKDAILAVADKVIDSIKGLFADDIQNSQAMASAETQLKELLNSTIIDVGGARGGYSNDASKINDSANAYNVIVKSDGAYGISLSNMASAFLTYYALICGEYDVPYNVRNRVDDSDLVTEDPNYYYVLRNEDAVTEKDMLLGNFYSMMYNNICKTGWTTASGNVDDKEYLSHAIKNGQLFISSLNTDNTYYQDPYTFNGHVIEVTDEDAITQAELEYEQTKSTLNYKEEQLELDMKNIDTEISALTTEYDTVKNLISKNVEKVFTMFSS